MLHKFSKVRGFHLHATDGAIGHVDDFLFDETHALRYLVVDTSHFWSHKWMLIACAAVAKIDAPDDAQGLRRSSRFFSVRGLGFDVTRALSAPARGVWSASHRNSVRP